MIARLQFLLRDFMNIESKNRYNNLPIIIVALYLLLTFFAYLLYYKDSGFQVLAVFVYCLATFGSLFIGYTLSSGSVKKAKVKRLEIKTRKSKKNKSKTSKFNYSLFLYVCFLITIIVYTYYIFCYYKSFEDILYYALNPGKAYEYIKFMNTSNSVRSLFDGFLGTVIGVLFNLLLMTKNFQIGVLISKYDKISFFSAVFTLFSLLYYFLYCLLFGTMINVVVLFFVSAPFLLKKIIENSSRKRTVWFYIAIPVLLVMFACVIIMFLGDRSAYGDGSSIFLSGIEGIMDYIGQGYHALSLDLGLSFQTTFGQTTFYGFSSLLVEKQLIPDLFYKSYMYRCDTLYGWPALAKWSTVIPWIASDFSFYLVPVIFFFIGVAAKKIWLDFKNNDSILPGFILGQFFVFSFMIPANNQLFLTFLNGITFLVSLALYFYFLKTNKKEVFYEDSNVHYFEISI